MCALGSSASSAAPPAPLRRPARRGTRPKMWSPVEMSLRTSERAVMRPTVCMSDEYFFYPSPFYYTFLKLMLRCLCAKYELNLFQRRDPTYLHSQTARHQTPSATQELSGSASRRAEQKLFPEKSTVRRRKVLVWPCPVDVTTRNYSGFAGRTFQLKDRAPRLAALLIVLTMAVMHRSTLYALPLTGHESRIRSRKSKTQNVSLIAGPPLFPHTGAYRDIPIISSIHLDDAKTKNLRQGG